LIKREIKRSFLHFYIFSSAAEILASLAGLSWKELAALNKYFNKAGLPYQLVLQTMRPMCILLTVKSTPPPTPKKASSFCAWATQSQF
jgi:hypothetical protein